MKRLTARWTIALATATVLTAPPANAQTPQNPPEPQPQQSTTLSTPAGQNASAAEHLRQAKDALKSIDESAVPAKAKSQFAALNRHINALERSIAANDHASATGATNRSPQATRDARGSANWASDVAAIDKIISELAGTASMTGTGDPGTAGTAGAEPKTTTSSKPSAAVTLDDAARGHLMEVRTHITAFAAAMSGTSQTPSTAASASTPSSTAASPSAPSSPAPAAQSPTAQSPSATSAASTTDPASPSSTAQSPSSPTEPSAPAGQSTTTAAAQTPSTPQADVDAAAAKQHLTAARESLTQLTQLPAAAQLQGDARTQVSQLIQNFNELITTQENWRDVYAKVEANITALIGPPATTDAAMTTTPPAAAPETSPTNPPAAPANPPANPEAGTPGAVGTSGTTGGTLDPAIRQKLVDFRTHLTAFHKAAGGQPQ